MSELTDKLTAAGELHKGTELGSLLQWAVLHINEQHDALAEAREELQTEQAERIRMEQAIHTAKGQMQQVVGLLDYSRPVNIELAKDHAPHINIMAHHGVAPYAKKRPTPAA